MPKKTQDSTPESVPETEHEEQELPEYLPTSLGQVEIHTVVDPGIDAEPLEETN